MSPGDSSEAAASRSGGHGVARGGKATELHRAAKRGDAAAIAALLESGADPDGDALQTAADGGHSHGSNGWTPLHEVAGKFTSNLPLLVIGRPFLRDCLRKQREDGALRAPRCSWRAALGRR